MVVNELCQAMAVELGQVRGVKAVVLGGSRARGTHHEGSDVDLGVYYERDRLDLDGLRALARRLTNAEIDVTGPGGWGPWVDGGAWLTVQGTAVDWILRDVQRVGAQCDRAARGQFAFHAQPGHPLGFLDVSYAGEAVMCQPLVDPDGVIERLRERVAPYPSALRQALIANAWQADFLLDCAAKGAKKGDTAFVALCCSTAAMVCAHAWHAAAEVWVLNEKDLVPGVDRLSLDTGTFTRDAMTALAALGSGEESLHLAIASMRQAVIATPERLC